MPFLPRELDLFCAQALPWRSCGQREEAWGREEPCWRSYQSLGWSPRVPVLQSCSLRLLPARGFLQDTGLAGRSGLGVPSSRSARAAGPGRAPRSGSETLDFLSPPPLRPLAATNTLVLTFPSLASILNSQTSKDSGKSILKVEPDAQTDLTWQFAAGST